MYLKIYVDTISFWPPWWPLLSLSHTTVPSCVVSCFYVFFTKMWKHFSINKIWLKKKKFGNIWPRKQTPNRVLLHSWKLSVSLTCATKSVPWFLSDWWPRCVHSFTEHCFLYHILNMHNKHIIINKHNAFSVLYHSMDFYCSSMHLVTKYLRAINEVDVWSLLSACDCRSQEADTVVI